jgi:hypothetical protein
VKVSNFLLLQGVDIKHRLFDLSTAKQKENITEKCDIDPKTSRPDERRYCGLPCSSGGSIATQKPDSTTTKREYCAVNVKRECSGGCQDFEKRGERSLKATETNIFRLREIIFDERILIRQQLRRAKLI